MCNTEAYGMEHCGIWSVRLFGQPWNDTGYSGREHHALQVPSDQS
jgi:hypothetical protein